MFTDSALGTDPVESARALLQSGRTREAAAAWEEAARSAGAAGDLAAEARWWRAGAFAAWRGRDFSGALRMLGQAEALSNEPTAQASVLYYRGLVFIDLGGFRKARQALDMATALTAEVENPALRLGIAEARAGLADQEGRPQDALTVLLATHPPKEGYFNHANSIGWILLSLASQDAMYLPEAHAWLHFAAERATEDDYRPGEAAAGANLAWAALLAGDLPAAEAHITEVRDLQVDYDALFLDLVDGDRLLALGEPAEAGQRFADAERTARAGIAGDSEGGWRARFGQCRAHRALGELAAARSDCLAALAELERVGTGTTLRSGRVPFFAARRTLLDETLDMLADDPDRAFTVADNARARVLRALQAQSRLDGLDPAQEATFGARLTAFHEAREALERHLAQAELTADVDLWRAGLAQREATHEAALAAAFEYLDDVGPLTAPGGASGAAIRQWIQADEALLALSRHRDGWLAFFVADGRIEVAPVQDDPLTPFSSRLNRQHLYVVPGGHPAAPELHRRLLSQMSVSYAPYAGLLLRPPPAGRGNLVIADPRLDLPVSGGYARTLATTRGAQLIHGRAATRAAVLPVLSGPNLIHFAGHGVLQADDPWSAWLALAGDDRLALPDLLTRPLNAQLVVLSGCETGPDTALADEAIGLPAAFLAAGAASVIASDRPVQDGAAARFFSLFYENDGAAHPAAALRRAATVQGEAHFRLWGRR